MTPHQTIYHWLTDYAYMVRGSAGALLYQKPPKHYLEYVEIGKVPVILIPGILGKWGFMKSLGDRMSKDGHPVYVVPKLGYNIFSIPRSAKILSTLIRHVSPARGHIAPRVSHGGDALSEVIEKNNLRGIVLVAHSKGGLIGKYFLAHHNQDGRVLGMVAIATPFSGSAMAKLLPLDSVKELDVDSRIIRDLESHKEVNDKIISICPKYDNHVWAEKGSHLDGAENIDVSVRGHHKVLFDTHVQKVVLRAIDSLSA